MKCRIPGYMKILKCRVLRLAGFLLLIHAQAFAQQLPIDVSTVVNGYQDDFDGASLNPNWLVAGEDVYFVASGMLHISSANGDPNHLLYAVPGYDDTVQEVLSYVQFSSEDLVARFRRIAEASVRRRQLSFEESAELLRRYERGLKGYTYLGP